MKALFKFLIRLVIFGGLFFVIANTNPTRETHQQAILRQMEKEADRDPLRQINGLLHEVQERLGISPYTYHDYKLLSLMKDHEGQNVSLGVASRVFVLKSGFFE
ncbi:MAG: hypothetical protein JJU05_05925 [Verrucomicrobia bacterium]|nr:hypothetical protein [Verrucomicrobiota bacterium]MCH8525679.1 hypothetical protein [Kiritimatiellia bacterium]